MPIFLYGFCLKVVTFVSSTAIYIVSFMLQLKTKRQNIIEKSTERKTKIGHSSQYQNFEREVDETKVWLAEKLKIATDESYRVSKRLAVCL